MLIREARRRDITLKIMPYGFNKRKLNRTWYLKKYVYKMVILLRDMAQFFQQDTFNPETSRRLGLSVFSLILIATLEKSFYLAYNDVSLLF